MEVLPGIHLLKGVMWSNAYLLEDGNQLVLVDAGLAPGSDKFFNYVYAIGRDPSELNTIILTHGHPDHTAGLRRLQRTTSARVLVHSDDAKLDAKGRHWVYYPSQPMAREWGIPLLQKLYVDELVHGGQVLPIMGGLEVLHTPGHTPGSIVLHLRHRGVIFTGDSLLSDGKVFRRPLPFPGTDFKAYRSSVERIARLDFTVALPGHGKPLVGAGKDSVREVLQRYFWAFAWGRALRGMAPRRSKSRVRAKVPRGAGEPTGV